MEVILRQDVSGLGKAGAVVKVKDGFARNFLIPNNLALVLNAANLKK
ncbi:MAG: 50S ribosomal protein L9, partial [Deltaproteobacteria bacterium]